MATDVEVYLLDQIIARFLLVSDENLVKHEIDEKIFSFSMRFLLKFLREKSKDSRKNHFIYYLFIIYLLTLLLKPKIGGKKFSS